MEDHYHHFFQALQRRLAQPLPGTAAHQKMASPTRTSNSYLLAPNQKTRQSAVLLLLYPYGEDVCFPLILRPVYDGVHGGQIALPGGGRERYDATLVRTALREAQEEIGIKASDVRVLGQLTELYVSASNYLVLPVVGYLPYRPDFFPDSHEVADIIELSLTTLTDQSIVGRQEMVVGNGSIQAPFYGVHNHVVWGATAMMLSEFLMVLQDVKGLGNTS